MAAAMIATMGHGIIIAWAPQSGAGVVVPAADVTPAPIAMLHQSRQSVSTCAVDVRAERIHVVNVHRSQCFLLRVMRSWNHYQKKVRLGISAIPGFGAGYLLRRGGDTEIFLYAARQPAESGSVQAPSVQAASAASASAVEIKPRPRQYSTSIFLTVPEWPVTSPQLVPDPVPQHPLPIAAPATLVITPCLYISSNSMGM